ncbi:MAG: PAS domain-containing protein [Stellaceae bacterium]
MSAAPKFHSDGIRGANDLAAPADPILVRLFNYWESKRAGRLMPSRADINPTELRGLVNHVMLYDVVEPGSLFRIRLVGQAIVDFVGVNHTGKMTTETLPPDAAKRLVEILTSVVTNRSPRFRAGYAYWHVAKSFRKFEACFLPLSPDGQTVDKIIGGHTFDADG